MTNSPKEPCGEKPADNLVPPDWEERWNEPILWPRPEGAKLRDRKAEIDAHREYVPDLSQSVLVQIDVDKKAFDRQIEEYTAYDAEIGRAYAERVYDVALPNMIRVLEFFREVGRPVVFVHWGWHRNPYPPLRPKWGEEVIVKYARGAFGASGLDAWLRRQGVKTCFFTGADTAMCVAATVRGAIDHNYRAVLVEDACASVRRDLHEATVRVLGYMQAHVLGTERVLGLNRSQR